MADAGLYVERLAAEIDHREERLLLVLQPAQCTEFAIVHVVLESDRPGIRDVVGEPCGRDEVERADAIEAAVDDRIDDEIDRAVAYADDRPHFHAEMRRIPMAGVVAELEIDGVKE